MIGKPIYCTRSMIGSFGVILMDTHCTLIRSENQPLKPLFHLKSGSLSFDSHCYIKNNSSPTYRSNKLPKKTINITLVQSNNTLIGVVKIKYNISKKVTIHSKLSLVEKSCRYGRVQVLAQFVELYHYELKPVNIMVNMSKIMLK